MGAKHPMRLPSSCIGLLSTISICIAGTSSGGKRVQHASRDESVIRANMRWHSAPRQQGKTDGRQKLMHI
jgi:hypothetical protein